ncbi:MAG TPA: hypothetical protein ENF80_00495 [Thermofilum sp.]|nr:hypothetical protein [Thermofilum sp.]
MKNKIIGYMSKSPEGDILRVLGMFGGSLWLSEIEDEIRSMNSSLNIETVGNVKGGIKNVGKDGIVNVEKRERGSLSGTSISDYLVKLNKWHEVILVLSGDKKFRDYNTLRSSLYRGLR